MRGPSSLQPSVGNLVDSHRMFQVVKRPEVNISSRKSAQKEGSAGHVQYIRQEIPERHQHQKAGREQTRGGLFRLVVMSLVKRIENTFLIVKEPAMDAVLNQAKDEQANDRTDQN